MINKNVWYITLIFSSLLRAVFLRPRVVGRQQDWHKAWSTPWWPPDVHLAVLQSHGKSRINGEFHGKIIYKWAISMAMLNN